MGMFSTNRCTFRFRLNGELGAGLEYLILLLTRCSALAIGLPN